MRAPTGHDGPRIPLYNPEYAAEPHKLYEHMRSLHPSLVPVELVPGVPATLVIGYHTAVSILNDPERFPSDPRNWETGIPADCPVRPMMQYRPNARHSDGFEHTRHRSANIAALTGIDLNALHREIERVAGSLINSFCEHGQAELIGQYIRPLAFAALSAVLGCPADLARQAVAGFDAIFNGVDPADAAIGYMQAADAMLELSRRKRAQPGDDVTSHLIRHRSGFTDEEMVHQLTTLFGAGAEPQMNLIANTLRLILTDERFAAGMLDGRLSTRDAVDEVLFTDPPVANYCATYPRQPVLIDGYWIPPHQPVLIGITACNTDPRVTSGDIRHNSSHLAWGAGPHSCPARSVAGVVVQDAIDQLLDALPDITLAIPPAELEWRPGPFHRALKSLPVTFPPSPPLYIGGSG
ncbi:cytochrome P450 [Nocardia carnea]|uniref:cytochrome P450 n=1 Tax=Nocardia carnea TaxID=37328 RepID=UPI0024556C01|nr:cytochrome P450 [Nocardia carnea]